jgi:hypothetical protein
MGAASSSAGGSAGGSSSASSTPRDPIFANVPALMREAQALAACEFQTQGINVDLQRPRCAFANGMHTYAPTCTNMRRSHALMRALTPAAAAAAANTHAAGTIADVRQLHQRFQKMVCGYSLVEPQLQCVMAFKEGLEADVSARVHCCC